MSSRMFLGENDLLKIKRSDNILKLMALYFVGDVLFRYFMPTSGLIGLTPYISVVGEILISLFIIYDEGGDINVNIESGIAIIYLTSTFVFTLAHVGIMSAIIAVCKEYFILLVCVFLRNRRYSMKSFRNVLKIVVVFTILSIVAAIINDDLLGKIFGFANVYDADIKSFFISKNQYGRFLYLATICTFFLFMHTKKCFAKYIYMILTGIFTLATALTFSRTSLLSLGIFYIMYYLVTSREKLGRNLLIVSAGIVVLILILSNDFLMDYINSFIIRKDVGIDSRSDIWVIGFDYIKHHPLIGAGEFMAEKVINAGGIYLSEFHNAYIYRMFASGIPISLLWLVLIIKRFIVLFSNCRKQPVLYFSIALFVSLLVYINLEQYGIFQFSITGFMVILFLYIAPNTIENYREE